MKAKDLKNSILQMAVEGKLVPQDPADEPADVLLERIREEKRGLIAEGKAKFPKDGESIIYIGSDGSPYEKRVDAKGRVLSDKCIADEAPFEELPEGWAWARLASLFTKIGSGSTPTGGRTIYQNEGPILIRSQNVHNDGLRLDDVAHFARTLFVKRGSHVLPNDMLLNITGASIGRCAIVPDIFEDADVNQHVLIMRPVDSNVSEYLHLAIVSPLIQAAIMADQVGATKEGLSATKAAGLLIPFPPLAEQRRIVGRVEELMPIVEEYGELEDAREALDAALPDRLRKSVLQMAVQGKLVPQDPADEPAGALLGRIREQRAELVRQKKMKAPKGGESVIFTGSDGRRYEKRVDSKGRESEPACIEDEIPFEIPESWEWARLGSLVCNRGQKRPDSRFCYIDIASVDNTTQKLGEETVLEASDAPSRARKIVALDDVLYSTVRPYLHNACIIDRCFEYEPIASTGFAVLTCPSGYLPSFLLSYLISPCFDEYANASENSKGVAYPAINDTRLYQAIVPIPPTSEQERIVREISSVLTLITNQ